MLCCSTLSFHLLRAVFQIGRLLPEEYKVTSSLAEHQPMNEHSPVYPFTGFVINFNVCVSGHRDAKDETLCVVLVFSDCEGGELILYEPGLVVKLGNGRGIVFTSVKTTHLNMHYVGERVSLVFSTDRYGSTWLKDRGAWEGKKGFASVDNI